MDVACSPSTALLRCSPRVPTGGPLRPASAPARASGGRGRLDRGHLARAASAPHVDPHPVGTLSAMGTASGTNARSPLRREGPDKLTGAARFTDDLVVPGAWFGVTVRSTEPHARLLGIDLDPAFDWSWVVVVTAADIPGENVVDLIVDDQPALVADEIRHVAEPVALVAAPTRRSPAPPGTPSASGPSRCPRCSTRSRPRAFASRSRSRRATSRPASPRPTSSSRAPTATGHQEQLYIEPQAMIAVPARRRRRRPCPRLAAVPVLRPRGAGAGARPGPTTGSSSSRRRPAAAFGGKEEYPSILAIHAALLARKAGRPVRMVYDRHEDIAATTKRHPSIVRHRTGVTRTGSLVAQDIDDRVRRRRLHDAVAGGPVARRRSTPAARTPAPTSGSAPGRR